MSSSHHNKNVKLSSPKTLHKHESSNKYTLIRKSNKRTSTRRSSMLSSANKESFRFWPRSPLMSMAKSSFSSICALTLLISCDTSCILCKPTNIKVQSAISQISVYYSHLQFHLNKPCNNLFLTTFQNNTIELNKLPSHQLFSWLISVKGKTFFFLQKKKKPSYCWISLLFLHGRILSWVHYTQLKVPFLIQVTNVKFC